MERRKKENRTKIQNLTDFLMTEPSPTWPGAAQGGRWNASSLNQPPAEGLGWTRAGSPQPNERINDLMN